jgi:molecular chaperone DnaJ
MKDYYKILEVEEKASADDIKKSYRALSKKYHPDVNPEGAEQFKEIAEAYDTLSDAEKRGKYDQTKNNPFAGGGGGSSFQDIFNQMFGGGAQQSRQRPMRKSAPDKIVRVQVSPVESYKGVQKTIRYVKDNHCDSCNGKGGDQQTCGTCRGQGFQVKVFGTGFMTQQIRQTCSTCAGRGYTLIHKCYVCSGNGIKSVANEINVTLPKGVDDGQYLKVANSGDFRNGEYGDLILQIQMVPKDGYEKINNDLIYNLYLNLEEVQKDKFIIPHPDGDLQMDAPKSFDTSKPLRLKNKGFNGGDMYVKLNVKFERPN